MSTIGPPLATPTRFCATGSKMEQATISRRNCSRVSGCQMCRLIATKARIWSQREEHTPSLAKPSLVLGTDRETARCYPQNILKFPEKIVSHTREPATWLRHRGKHKTVKLST